MHFRPYPVLTIIAVPALAVLVGLGVWRSQRAGWKSDEIAKFEAAAKASPESPEQALCAGKPAEGTVVAPPKASGKSLRMFGHNAAGDAGWRLFQAAQLSCGAVFAETGFEPLDIGGPGGAPLVRQKAAPDRFLVEAWPAKPLMAAENAPDRNEWHWFDAPLMGAAAGAAPLNAAFILTPLSGMPDFLTRTPPETHIGYAVTWFGMAAAFAVIYALFHARAGRLRFRKKRENRGAPKP
jgi:surfeit locus 1 family protein